MILWKWNQVLKNYGNNFEVELSKGLFAGQSLIPVNTAGCYIPAGRYAHIASAVMSITTAKVAGVKNIIACSSPKPNTGAHPKIIYTANLCGADVILNLGGVPAIAAMTYGMFGNKPFDKDQHKKYLQHEKIENLIGLEIDLVYQWEVGSILIFDRSTKFFL